MRATTPFTGYMELGELSRLFAVNPATIRRRLQAQGRSLYVSPIDQRLRMVAEEDIRAIFQIVPAPQRTREDGVPES
jgi:hypothetical protein